MRGSSRTKSEVAFQGAVASLNCIACMFDGRANSMTQIHHIAGRTRPGAHMKVIPLCPQHHMHDDTDPLGRVGIHPWKARFEAMYGTQEQLYALTLRMLEGRQKNGPVTAQTVPSLHPHQL